MKKTLLALFVFPLLCYSQDCQNLIKKGINHAKDTITLSYPIRKLSQSKCIVFYMDIQDTNDGDILLLIQITDDNFGCTDDGSKIYLLFTDNTMQTFSNTSLNCKGFSMGFIEREHHEEQKSYEEALCNKTIKAIKVESINNAYETAVMAPQAEQFRQSAKCLFKK
jgi:hypothetical protein